MADSGSLSANLSSIDSKLVLLLENPTQKCFALIPVQKRQASEESDSIITVFSFLLEML